LTIRKYEGWYRHRETNACVYVRNTCLSKNGDEVGAAVMSAQLRNSELVVLEGTPIVFIPFKNFRDYQRVNAGGAPLFDDEMNTIWLRDVVTREDLDPAHLERLGIEHIPTATDEDVGTW
jgi:hypothetical protein